MVNVVLSQHLPALQQKPEFSNQGRWKVIKRSKNKDEMAGAMVALQVVAALSSPWSPLVIDQVDYRTLACDVLHYLGCGS